METKYIGLRTDNNGWKHFLWQCTIRGKTYDYRMGIAHAEQVQVRDTRFGSDMRSQELGAMRYVYKEAVSRGFTQAHARKLKYVEGNFPKKLYIPTSPDEKGVMYALLADAEAVTQTFEDWADSYGYDTDSKKAEATYNACRDNGYKLYGTFTTAELEQWRKDLEDY